MELPYQRHRWQIRHQCQLHQRQICHRNQQHRQQILPLVPLVFLILVANLPQVSTAANFPQVSTILAANFPPVSTLLMANCRGYQRHQRQIWRTISDCWLEGKIYLLIFFICNQCQWLPWCTLSCEYLRKFSKIRNGPNGILRGLGKLIHKKPEVENLVALSL